MGYWVHDLGVIYLGHFTLCSMTAPVNRLAPFTPVLSTSTEWVKAAPNPERVQFLPIHTRQGESRVLIHYLFLGRRVREKWLSLKEERMETFLPIPECHFLILPIFGSFPFRENKTRNRFWFLPVLLLSFPGYSQRTAPFSNLTQKWISPPDPLTVLLHVCIRKRMGERARMKAHWG